MTNNIDFCTSEALILEKNSYLYLDELVLVNVRNKHGLPQLGTMFRYSGSGKFLNVEERRRGQLDHSLNLLKAF